VLLDSLLPLPCAAPLGADAAATAEESSPSPGAGSGGEAGPAGPGAASAADAGGAQPPLAWRVEACSTLEAAAHAFGVADAYERKPLLDGRAIIAETGAQGKRVGALVNAVERWQLTHPAGDRDECLAWLRASHEGIK